jgi:hypothetical protein
MTPNPLRINYPFVTYIGKICSTSGCLKIGTVDFFLKSTRGQFGKVCTIGVGNHLMQLRKVLP